MYQAECIGPNTILQSILLDQRYFSREILIFYEVFVGVREICGSASVLAEAPSLSPFSLSFSWINTSLQDFLPLFTSTTNFILDPTSASSLGIRWSSSQFLQSLLLASNLHLLVQHIVRNPTSPSKRVTRLRGTSPPHPKS